MLIGHLGKIKIEILLVLYLMNKICTFIYQL